MAYLAQRNTHQYFRPKVQEWGAHVDNPVAMSLARSGTIAVHDSAIQHPPKSPVTPVAVVYRDFLQEEERDRLTWAPLHGHQLELRRQAEQAAVWRSVKLSLETAMDWLMRRSYPGAKEKPDLFLEMDRSSHLLTPFPESPYASKPTLHICLSAPPDGALIHATDKGTIPTIFLHPGDAILLHPVACMRLCEGHEVETAFLRFYSDVNHPAGMAEVQAALPVPAPEVEVEEGDEDRELQAKLDAKRSAMFGEKKTAWAAEADEVEAKKKALKARIEAQEKEKRMGKEEKRRWDAIVAEEKQDWDAKRKKREADDREMAELEEISRRNQEEVEALRRENERRVVDTEAWAAMAGPPVSAMASASTSAQAADRKGKGREMTGADKVIDLASSQISVKAEPDAEDSPEWDAPPAYPSPSVIEPAKQTRKRKASSIAIPAPAPAEETAKSTRRGRAY